jgi:hypothetical protein
MRASVPSCSGEEILQCPVEWRRAVRWTSLLGTGLSKAVLGRSS